MKYNAAAEATFTVRCLRIAQVVLSRNVCPSVRLLDCYTPLRYCVKTAKYIIKFHF